MKIRYYGHVGQRTGYGQAANAFCLALHRAGAELDIRPLAPAAQVSLAGASLPLARFLRKDNELLVNPHAIIVHTLPLDCKRVLEIAQQQCTSPGHDFYGAQTVAYTTWEALAAPEEVTSGLAEFDAVWSPSSSSLRGLSYVPKDATPPDGSAPHGPEYRVLPHCFDEESLGARLDRQEDKGDRAFTFYYVGAWSGRKNIAGIIKAYAHTFKAGERVRLMLSCAGVTDRQFMAAIHATGIPQSEIPRIEFNNRYVTDEEMIAFHRDEVDCFVSASRGEAWNLPAFEAMLAGRHIIAPFGQGSDDYLASNGGTTADLYPAAYTPAELDVAITPGPKDRPEMYGLAVGGVQGLTSRCLWHEPDLMSLSSFMRSSFEHPSRYITCFYNPIERYGYAAVAKQALGYLEGLE
jgi:glycosyltransferase involved in cell wall biosynthesis